MNSGFATDCHWPEQPYRGLNYFRPQDRPLLGGRDADVSACSMLLAHPQTRVLMLHGSTGCGKSSFLRAGLIPTMESDGAGYLFLKIPGTDDEALFIRCTEAPTDQIARRVFLFAEKPFQLRTPIGFRELDLRPALLGSGTWTEYLALAREEEGLLASLSKIAELIPQTLVLIVDQAEEVLTLNPGEQNFTNRVRFFHFLRAFQKLPFDSRIIIALRTEFYGRFTDATQIGYRASAEFQSFFLGELSHDAMVGAILRPTLQGDVGQFGVPFAKYNFSFGDGLPELIVSDIQRTSNSGPALPILQLVCLKLYEDCKRNGRTIIKEVEYRSSGGVEGQIILHITSTIRSLYDNEEDFRVDLEAVRASLALFYTMQDDGSVVSRTVDSAWTLTDLRKRGLHISAEVLIDRLTSPQSMILRGLRNVRADGRTVDQLTLGHDTIALALERWKSSDAEERAKNAKRTAGELERRIVEQLKDLQQAQQEISVGRKLYGKVAAATPALVANIVAFLGVGISIVPFIKELSKFLGGYLSPNIDLDTLMWIVGSPIILALGFLVRQNFKLVSSIRSARSDHDFKE